MSRDGQIVFRPRCPLDNHIPESGCPRLIPGGIIVSLHLKIRKIQLPTGQPRLLRWLPSGIFWLSRATGLPHFSIPEFMYTLNSAMSHDLQVDQSETAILERGQYKLDFSE